MTKRIGLFIIIIMAISLTMTSQSCLPDGITFITQGAIDSFPVHYPGCTAIDGDITFAVSDIINVDSLYMLTAFNGDVLFTHCFSLLNLHGLSNVVWIGGDLKFLNNTGLDNYVGLSNLTHIGGSLSIESGNTQNLEGFEGLMNVDGAISIIGNYYLSDISAMSGLSIIEGTLEISNNAALSSLIGLNNIDSIAGSIVLTDCPMISLSGLEGLVYLEGGMRIEENENLNDLSQLFNLTEISGPIMVNANNSLTSLYGLDNIAAESIDGVFISFNPLLSQCAVQSICERFSIPGANSYFQSNADGCKSNDEVIEACESLSVEEGNIIDIIQLYPNPATAEINLRFSIRDFRSSLFIYDIYGRMHYEGAIPEGQVQIDVSDYLNGVYFVVLQNEKRLLGKQIFVVSK